MALLGMGPMFDKLQFVAVSVARLFQQNDKLKFVGLPAGNDDSFSW